MTEALDARTGEVFVHNTQLHSEVDQLRLANQKLLADLAHERSLRHQAEEARQAEVAAERARGQKARDEVGAGTLWRGGRGCRREGSSAAAPQRSVA